MHGFALSGGSDRVVIPVRGQPRHRRKVRAVAAVVADISDGPTFESLHGRRRVDLPEELMAMLLTVARAAASSEDVAVVVGEPEGPEELTLTSQQHCKPSMYWGLVPLRYSGTVGSCQSKESLTVAISASEARARLFPLIQQVNDDHLPVRTTSKGGGAVLMSAEDFDSWQEIVYLLRSPANARRLMEAVQRDRSGRGTIAKTMEELQDLTGE